MYWASPLGRHPCPNCLAKLSLRHTYRYYLSLVGLFAIFSFVPAAVATLFDADGSTVLLIYLVGSAFVFYFDKKIDDSWRGCVERK